MVYVCVLSSVVCACICCEFVLYVVWMCYIVNVCYEGVVCGVVYGVSYVCAML